MLNSRTLRVFLCHASQDKPIVREFYQRLLGERWIDPWLDEEKLLPGQDWDLEIEKAVEGADVVIACLSTHSVSKEGYVQRELKFVLDIALEKPEGTIFVIPLRLDDCPVPRRLRSWQYVDYFPLEYRKRAYQRLLQSLHARHDQLEANTDVPEVDESYAVKPSLPSVEERVAAPKNPPDHLTLSVPTTRSGILELGGSILPILFFAQLVPFLLGTYDDVSWFLLAVTTILFAVQLAFKRELVASRWLKFATIFFIATHGLLMFSQSIGEMVWDVMLILDGLAALLVGVLYVLNFKLPRQPMPYAAGFFAAFLLLYAMKLLLDLFGVYPSWIQAPLMTVGLITIIFLWLER